MDAKIRFRHFRYTLFWFGFVLFSVASTVGFSILSVAFLAHQHEIFCVNKLVDIVDDDDDTRTIIFIISIISNPFLLFFLLLLSLCTVCSGHCVLVIHNFLLNKTQSFILLLGFTNYRRQSIVIFQIFD